MTKDEALRLALEALEYSVSPGKKNPAIIAITAITAIKQALEQPEPPCKTGSQCTSKCDGCAESEPVAWATHHEPPMFFYTKSEAALYCDYDESPIPVYTSPPKREWQGLTDEEVFDIWLNEMPAPDKVFYQKLCRSVEAKLKEKNT